MSAELSWNGGTSWTAADTDGVETTTEHTGLLGGASDIWGRAWTASELSNANFRVRLTTSCVPNGLEISFRPLLPPGLGAGDGVLRAVGEVRAGDKEVGDENHCSRRTASRWA